MGLILCFQKFCEHICGNETLILDIPISYIANPYTNTIPDTYK